MHNQGFLESLAVVLCVAAVTSVLFQRLHQPVVLGYILAGLIVGPHVPIPLIVDSNIVHTLSDLGVILLMFSLGLEFSIRKFLNVGFTAGVTALIECSFQIWLGLVTARAFGWSVRESLFTGAVIAISSTTIIAKAFNERPVSRDLRSLVVSVLIVEDLIAIVLMAALTATGQSETLSLMTLARPSGRLGAFLAVTLLVGLLIIPRGFRAVAALQKPETLLVASIGCCFGLAYLAHSFGYSVALGSFLAGALIAESGKARKIEPLIEPVRDMFAAVFFVSVGMSIDPVMISLHYQAVLVLTALVMGGKLIGVTLGSFLSGAGIRSSIRAGMTMAQIGEFSFILAGLGRSLGATREFLYPTVAAVAAITTLTTPWMIRFSDEAARRFEHRLPASAQSFSAVYTGWAARLRSATRRGKTEPSTRRFAKLLALDALLAAGLTIGTAQYAAEAADAISAALSIGQRAARITVALAVFAVAAPLCVGIYNVVRHLALSLAETAVPQSLHDVQRPELGSSARRTLSITLQLVVLLLVGLPLVVVTQPFLSGVPGALLLALALLIASIAVMHNAQQLEGEVRAGTQLIAAAIQQSGRDARQSIGSRDDVQQFLAELGEPKQVQLKSESRAVGQTLVSLDVRGSTGATVLAIAREPDGAIFPTGREVLQENDVLLLAGTREAVAQARRLLN